MPLALAFDSAGTVPPMRIRMCLEKEGGESSWLESWSVTNEMTVQMCISVIQYDIFYPVLWHGCNADN